MQQKILKWSSLLLIVAALAVTEVTARCNTCNANKIACVSETSFQMCFNDERDSSQTYNCTSGKVCTATTQRCVDRDSIDETAIECPTSISCGVCTDDKMFTCISLTTFAQCNGTERTDIVGRCPQGLTCNSQANEICVTDCNLPSQLECTNEDTE